MSLRFEHSFAADYIDLMNNLRLFCSGRTTRAYAGVGTGFLKAVNFSTTPVVETWTITATSATNFTVTGSISGAQAAATVGTAYDNGKIKFTIQAGGVAFLAGDVFTCVVASLTTGAGGWAIQRDGTPGGADAGSYPNELVLKGQGDGGLDAIYVGVKAFSGNSIGEGNFFNWALNAFETFQSGTPFEQQPGGLRTPSAYNLTSPTLSTWPTVSHDLPPFICLDSSATPIEYWLVWEPRSIRMVAKIAGGAAYEPMYLGLDRPNQTPSQFPLPLFVGGSHTGVNAKWRYSDTDYTHSGFFDATLNQGFSALRYRHTDGNWRVIWNRNGGEALTAQNPQTWPFGPFGLTAMRENLDGSLTTWPLIAAYGDNLGSGDILGDLDGIVAVPGKIGTFPGTDQAAENTIGTSPVTHVIFPNVFRTDYSRFFALQVA